MSKEQLERSYQREQKLANYLLRKGEILAAQTARKIADRILQDLEELDERDEDETVRVGSYRWARDAEREE